MSKGVNASINANLLVNGGFEEGSWDGWSRLNGTTHWWNNQPSNSEAYEGTYRIYTNPDSSQGEPHFYQEIPICTANFTLSWAVRRHQDTNYPRLVYATAYDSDGNILADSSHSSRNTYKVGS